MGDSYLWIKTVHVLAVISWMAGLFYLPRLFVYHAEKGAAREISETFKIMEQRLLKAIMRPAGLAAIVTGALLIWSGGWTDPMPRWLWLKLFLVAGMLVFHGILERHTVRFHNGVETSSGRYFRILNEVPTLLLIAIVILVVVKPF
jgi:putative membrane protein